MKNKTFLYNALGLILCGLTAPLAANNCAPVCAPAPQNCCDWSFCDGKMTAGAEWLYWKTTQDNMELGTVDTFSAGSAFVTPVAQAGALVTPLTTQDSVKQNPKYNYANGFRVNIGYELPADKWDTRVTYSYMPTSAHYSSVAIPAQTGATPTVLPANAYTAQIGFTPNNELIPVDLFANNLKATTAGTFAKNTQAYSAKWNATLNNIDFDLGRTVAFSECFKLRPHVGFRAAWFDQNLKFNDAYSYTGATGNLDNIAITNAYSAKEKFTGYGVETGLFSEWNLGYGLTLVGHLGGSILYSEFKIKSEQNATFSESIILTPANITTATSAAFRKETIHTGTPTVDYFVGLQYADTVCDMMFSAVIGWEEHIIFNANRLNTDTGNLSTQGLTLGLQLDF